MSTKAKFEQLVIEAAEAIGDRPLDGALSDFLNERFPAGSALFDGIRQACLNGIEEGWMCDREAGGIRFGRVVRALHGPRAFSVDVVLMEDVKGPHHIHPKGEIDLIMPLAPEGGKGAAGEGGARFDGAPAGWLVYGPGSAHHPTVAGGRALVLYLLPDGAIEFTGR